MNQTIDTAREALVRAGQQHVLEGFDQLDPAQQDSLLAQIASIDWPEVSRLIETHVKAAPRFAMPQDIQPSPHYPNKPDRKLKDKYRRARKRGEKLISEGKVAAFTVAGGQGTRLGWPGPKGTFPATAIRKAPLFGVLAEFIRKAQKKYQCVIPWYIMTSPENDTPTRDFFGQHGYFGLDPANVTMFPQAMMPAIDMQTHRVLMAEPGVLALSPNGHGGSLKALYTSGAIADMKTRGIEQISYTQIDNPTVKVVDPLFIGLHAVDKCQMSSKMIPKTTAKERVGNFCLVNNKVTVIEYTNLPDAYAEQCDEQGRLRFRAGSIAIHVMSVEFVDSLNRGEFALPFNRAEKKVPYFDRAAGKMVQPDKPNAIKLETFVFDALPFCDRSIVYETDRVEEFAPIKNADGPEPEKSVDSPHTSKLLQTERAARWLESHKVKIPRDARGQVNAVIEISHLTAIEAADLDDMQLPEEISPQTEVLL